MTSDAIAKNKQLFESTSKHLIIPAPLYGVRGDQTVQFDDERLNSWRRGKLQEEECDSSDVRNTQCPLPNAERPPLIMEESEEEL
ncbi:hypothetical protein CEXT_520141 [Caerostris extrusa]|uniref:Uncharacterized protein n=1 Tax=Caerostris extrusa TaxID=172846 RepID=A0AAV4N3S6_CAEEX|nr:hypothetical protein CEXT_520141 [Caerostris extrusa]